MSHDRLPPRPEPADDTVTAVAAEPGVAVSRVPRGGHGSAPAIALLVLSGLIFSTGGLFVRSLDHPRPWTTVFWREIAALASVGLVIAGQERRGAVRAVTRAGAPAWSVAVAICVSSVAMVTALTRTSVAVVLVIFALGPLAAAVLAWAMLGERIAGYTWAAIAVTVAGVAYMVSGSTGHGSVSGAVIAFAIPIAFGFATVRIRQHAEVKMAPAMFLSAVIAATVAAPFAHPLSVTRHDLVLLLVFGFAQLGVGLAIFSIGAARVPATEVALLSMLEPVMGPVWVWIFRDEYPGIPGLVGGTAVFVALVAHTLYAARVTSGQAVPALAAGQPERTSR